MPQDIAHKQGDISGFSPSHAVSSPSPLAKVSAIVVSYYTGPLLARSIASLKLQPEVTEIIIVDNGNWPDAVHKAAFSLDGPHEDDPDIHIISGHGNVGFSAACNLGVEKASTPYLLFLNPDAIMPQDGVEQMLRDGIDNETPWMMGAKLVGPDGIEQSGCRRITLTPWRAFVEASKLYHLAPRHPYFRRFNMTNEPCPRTLISVPVTSGACFLTPSKDYHLINGMDENYFLHVEDIDFCLRLRNAGGTVYYNPKIEVTHFKGSSRTSKVTIEYSKTKGMKRYFKQHFSNVYPPLFLPLVNGLLWVRFCMFAMIDFAKRTLAFLGLRKRRGKHAATRVRAHARLMASRHDEHRQNK